MAILKQLSFAGGEVAPALYGRVDQLKYQAGLKTCRNAYVQRFGSVTNRPGFEFVAEVKDSSLAAPRLIEFIFNDAQTYILEFGNLYMRVHKNGVQQRESATTITGATQADPCVVTVTAHGYSNGDEVYITAVVGMTQLNNRNFKVANTTANTFELQTMDSTDLDATGYTAYSSAGTAEKVYEITTPYTTAQLDDLNYIQNADIVMLTHQTHAPRELARTGDISWTLTTTVFAPLIGTPANVSFTGPADPAGADYTYHVTAVDAVTLEESLAGTDSQTGRGAANPTTPHTITWDAVTGAGHYAIYQENTTDGTSAGFVAQSRNTTFVNRGDPIDYVDLPPLAATVFDAVDKYPRTATFLQGRLLFGSSNKQPEKMWGSRVGSFRNFNRSEPIEVDLPLEFTLAGNQVNQIMHIADIGAPLVLTTGGVWLLKGDVDGNLTPRQINPRQQTYDGSAGIRPLIVSNVGLYVQARSSKIRDIFFEFQSDGYKGNDLTVFSAHLFDLYTIVDWAYQENPNSIAWIIRSDGTLLGLTYVRDHKISAWHRHDTDGTFERAAVVPDGREDKLYVVVNRTISGSTVRYIERMTTRTLDPAAADDMIFMDSSLSYEGENSAATTMTLSGGTTWAYDEDITLTSSVAYFVAGDVGNEIHIRDGATPPVLIRCEITAFTSTTIVTIRPHTTIPATLQATARTTWGKAVDEFGGLWHLEGKSVSVLADQFVVASPNNAATDAITVSAGSITIARPAVRVHVGLPYLSDIVPLDIDLASGETFVDKKLRISDVYLQLEDTRGVWAGPRAPDDDTVDPLQDLYTMKTRKDEDYQDPNSLKTDVSNIVIRGDFNFPGRVFVRQVDPLPMTILSISPKGDMPARKR